MKKFVLLALVFAGAWFYASAPDPALEPGPGHQLASATEPADYASGAQISGSGIVVRVLTDDNDGNRHQRFIVELESGRTLLIAHNIDLAPRVAGIRIGDPVEFYGQFESNPQGGVVHWTHRDPQRRHVAGWVRHDGRMYQ